MTETTPTVSSDDLIRRALAANGVFSAASGTIMAVFGGRLGDWMGVPTNVMRSVGLALIAGGAVLWLFSRRRQIRRAEAWTGLVVDELWVIGTIVLIVGFPTAMNATGNGVAAIIGLIVAGFATAELVGIRRMR